ncbi:MAG: V-type ATP synthase subunit E [Nitrospinota bacterium]
MGLEEIKKRLLDDARKEAEARLDAARKEAEEIRARGRRSAEETERKLLRKARHEAEARKGRLATDARLAAQKAILSEKRAAIDGVFQEAMERLAASKSDLRAGLRDALLEAIETGEETITLSPSDRDEWGEALVDELNRELEARGRKAGLRLADTGPEISAGAILHRPGVEVNLSLEVLGRQVRERLEEAVAEILFEETPSPEASR